MKITITDFGGQLKALKKKFEELAVPQNGQLGGPNEFPVHEGQYEIPLFR